MLRNLPIIILFLSVTINSLPQGRSSGENLRDIVNRNGQVRITLPFPGRAQAKLISDNVSVEYADDKKISVVLSPLTVEWFINSGFSYTITDESPSKTDLSSASTQQAMEWESYPTLPQYDSIMLLFTEKYPLLCRLDTIGTSIKGRKILALKISDTPGIDGEKPAVFYTSTIHGDETGGFILMMRLAEYLLENYNSDEEITDLVNNLDIWINPLANPDGTYNKGDTIGSPVRFNSNGYDLNRNFPDPDVRQSELQKETAEMIKFLRRHRFLLSANFHSGAEVVNYPWDRWQRYHADNDWFHSISRAYADTVHNYAPQGYMTDFEYGVTNGYEWYQINGGRQDFVTYELQGREVTIELDDEYITPPEKLGALWEYNRRSLIDYLGNALYGIHGKVIRKGNGKPVPAKIFIRGHDMDNSHVFADTLTGRFVRLISPGRWNLTFTAAGYRDTTVSDILVETGRRTDIIVEMDSVVTGIHSENSKNVLLYPNPAGEFVMVRLPENVFGRLRVEIFSLTGAKLSESVIEKNDISPRILDVKNLRNGFYIISITGETLKYKHNSRLIINH
ncbi:MAG: T9SS type A sorting domain-containing protein [Bacteroidales bacterium]|nr:T9SS type A sorting domain-containing protein [Bacteroidales bacterium]